MKSLIELYEVLSTEVESRCCTTARVVGRETRKDLAYFSRRIYHEGESFLTITLPQFGKDFERSLDQGKVTDDLFRGFSKQAVLPKLLGWALRLVFDPQTGVLLPKPDIDAIIGVRQLTLMFSKMLLACSDDRVIRAYERYEEVENEVTDSSRQLYDSSLDHLLRRTSRLLWSESLAVVDRDIHHRQLIPKHGPGATAERVTGNRKFRFRRWHRRLNDLFPPEDYVLPSHRYYSQLWSVDFVDPGDEPPVRVVHVPKTLKTPRLIAIEPVCMQYTQQAVAESLKRSIQEHPVLGKMIRPDECAQESNRELARLGSLSGSYATIDLSDASDRVSIVHVNAICDGHPLTKDAIFAVRSSRAQLPSGKLVSLTKYASMGSALTFPVEAMVFLSIIFVAIGRQRQQPVTWHLIKQMSDHVRVYGDDIIVPVEYVQSVIMELEAFGLKVNMSKSFWTGKFRESCGGDFYDGNDVGYVKLRRRLAFSPRCVEEFTSTVEFRNLMYLRGYWSTAKWLDERLGKGYPYPTVGPNSPAIGRISLIDYQVDKMSRFLHAPLVKALVRSDPSPVDRLGGSPALLKFFLKRGTEPFEKDHLERTGRPRFASIKTRWVSPF